MTRTPTRTPVPSSRLIRILSDLALMDVVEPGTAFAQKLGLWVDYSDAIALSAALSTSPAGSPITSPATSAQGSAVHEQLARLRASLENSMTRPGSTNNGRTLAQWPMPDLKLPVKVATAFEPYRRYYGSCQREMEAEIRSLRVNIRATLVRKSPALGQLATLDAALDKVLCDRESQLLAKVPLLLRKRFEHLLTTHQQALQDTHQADEPDAWMKEGGWLARFCNELQTVLLAELDVRLQPTLGLLEALHNEKK